MPFHPHYNRCSNCPDCQFFTTTNPIMSTDNLYLPIFPLKELKEDNNNNMNNIFKKLTDSKVKALVKAGFLASDLSLTIKGFDSLKEILFLANYDEMVKKAEEFNKENEKNQK